MTNKFIIRSANAHAEDDYESTDEVSRGYYCIELDAPPSAQHTREYMSEECDADCDELELRISEWDNAYIARWNELVEGF